MEKKKRIIRDFVEEYTMLNGRKINVLGEGRLINLANAECERVFETLSIPHFFAFTPHSAFCILNFDETLP